MVTGSPPCDVPGGDPDAVDVVAVVAVSGAAEVDGVSAGGNIGCPAEAVAAVGAGGAAPFSRPAQAAIVSAAATARPTVAIRPCRRRTARLPSRES